MTLSLLDTYRNCQDCKLSSCRTQVVFGAGKINPPIMLIGEAPGEDEDKQGIPFVGRAGQKLDKILAFLSLSREGVYISNSVLCRPPNNRTPERDELVACHNRLINEIELVNPKMIICLGKTALSQVLNKEIKDPIKNYFSLDEIVLNNNKYKLLVTYHPSYLLRSPVVGYQVTLPHWTKVKEWLKK